MNATTPRKREIFLAMACGFAAPFAIPYVVAVLTTIKFSLLGP
jgi:hypothetical protein